MHIEKLNLIKETLACAAESQMQNLEGVDAKELGEVIDIIKDIEETIYYCTITKAMEEGAYKSYQSDESSMYYGGRMRSQPPYYDDERYRDEWESPHRSYYDEVSKTSHMPTTSTHSSTGSMHSTKHGDTSYTEREFPGAFKDDREGKSYRSRRMYMEAKETKQDKTMQMKELENYAQELTQDVLDMIKDASADERQYLSRKIAGLANKITQISDNN